MTTIERCLCSSCSRTCAANLKSELALSGKLTYIYLKNGGKITNSCKIYNSRETSENKDSAASVRPASVGAAGRFGDTPDIPLPVRAVAEYKYAW